MWVQRQWRAHLWLLHQSQIQGNRFSSSCNSLFHARPLFVVRCYRWAPSGCARPRMWLQSPLELVPSSRMFTGVSSGSSSTCAMPHCKFTQPTSIASFQISSRIDPTMKKVNFIGVLDIAGFSIGEILSVQLVIWRSIDLWMHIYINIVLPRVWDLWIQYIWTDLHQPCQRKAATILQPYHVSHHVIIYANF